jgi:type II secretion system protein C
LPHAIPVFCHTLVGGFLNQKDRIILLMLLTACILFIGMWMVFYFNADISQITPRLFDSESTKPAASPDVASTKTKSPSPAPDFAENAAKPDSYLALPKELEHLRLIGTAVNSINEPCAVIDNRNTGSQGLYKKGDLIDSAAIVQIQNDYAVLMLNGKSYKLVLEKSTSSEPPLNTDELLQETPNPFIHTTQNDVEKAWDETQDLMTQIELEQHFENGEPMGVKIERISPDTVFEKIGFKPGDILIMVDDMEMNIADDAMEVYNCIRTKSAVQFTIIREGEPNPLILKYHSDMQ